MMGAVADMEARLAELKTAYLAGLPGHAARVRKCLERLQVADDADARSELRDIAHRLAGTGALYGIAELTAWGRATERATKAATVGELREAADALDGIIARASR